MPGDTRDIRINVTVDSDTRGSDQAAQSLQKVDKAAGGTEHSLGGLRKESEKLDVQLAKSKTRLRELEQELIRTGDRTTGRGSLRSRVNQERSWLRELERLTKSAEDSIIPELHLKLPKLDFSNLVSEARGGLIVGLVGVAALAAPAIGAIIAGAVAGTVTGGGIAGGVIAASADSRVRSAFKDLTSEFTAEAFGGEAFVGPVVEGLHILRDEFANLHIDEALAKGASSVPILAQGIADLVANVMPGFNRVMDQAETFTTVFAQGLGDTGTALSDMLISLMSSEGTIEGLAFGFKVLTGVIVGTGNTLEWLGNLFHKMVVFSAWATGGLEDFTRGLENVARATTQVLTFGMVNLDNNHQLSDSFASMNNSMEDVEKTGWGTGHSLAELEKIIRDGVDPTETQAEAMKKLNDEFERSIDLEASLMLTNLDIEEGLQNLADQFAKNGTALNDYTDEGRENERALIQMARKMREARDTAIELGTSTADADAALEANKERLYEQAEAAGISRAAIEGLIGALFRVPKVSFMGTAVTIGATNRTFGAGMQEFAGGGDTPAFEPFRVHNGEVMFSDRSHYVATKAQVDALQTRMGGGGGGSSTSAAPLNLYGGGLGQVVFEWLRTEIAARGGSLAVLGLRP